VACFPGEVEGSCDCTALYLLACLVGWPVEAYQVIGRADLVANLCSPDVDAEAKGGEVAAGRGTGSSSNRPILHGRTPLTKPQLRTPLPGMPQERTL
jgi:hypothetical protein